MCLAVPGKVVQWLDEDPLSARALIEFEGVKREVHMACVPEAAIDSYVLVHAGIAIGTIDEIEAAKLRDVLTQIGEFDIGPPNVSKAHHETR